MKVKLRSFQIKAIRKIIRIKKIERIFANSKQFRIFVFTKRENLLREKRNKKISEKT